MTKPGLRERKKAKTLRMIQQEALRLFGSQGYEATTIEQIADAAEVSPSTFYRYFPTKEDVVVQDEYDPMLVNFFRNQPTDVSPLQAIRSTIDAMKPEIAPYDQERLLGRLKLIVSVPALRARQYDQSLATERMIAQLVAERYNRKPHELLVRNFAATVVASWTTALTVWAEGDGQTDLAELMDSCVAHLGDGIPLES